MAAGSSVARYNTTDAPPVQAGKTGRCNLLCDIMPHVR